MTENNIPTSEILNRAADLVQQRGWASGEGWDTRGNGPLCLEGAIGAAMGIEDKHASQFIKCPASDAVRDYIAHENLGNLPLWLWNDYLRFGLLPDGTLTYQLPGGSRAAAREFSRDKVIATLRAAAAIEEARESDVAPLATTQREVSA